MGNGTFEMPVKFKIIFFAYHTILFWSNILSALLLFYEFESFSRILFLIAKNKSLTK